MVRRGFVYAFSMMLVVAGMVAPDLGAAEEESGSVDAAEVVVSPSKDYDNQLFTGTSPARLLDTRPTGVTHDGLSANEGAFSGVRTLQVAGRGGIPAGAGAVVVNVTVTNPVSQGYTTVFPTGSVRPNASSLNFVAGATVANAVVTKLSLGGSISIYNMARADVIVDVSGWLPADSDYHALDPARLTDTRPGRATIDGLESGGGTFSGGRSIKVTDRGGVPATGVGAVVLNVTSTRQSTAGYTTVYPTGETRPTTSNVNFVKGRDKAGLVITKVGTGGAVQMFNSIRSDLVVDVVGWFPLASDYTGLKPARLVDTRSGRSTIDGQDLADGAFSGSRSYRVLGRDKVPTRGSAVVLNVTVTEPATSGYSTVFPGGEARPVASNLNFAKNQTTSNLVVALVGLDGEVSIYNSSVTHLVVDVFGWLPGFVPASGTPDPAQISLSRGGLRGVAESTVASVSGDGRFTAYASEADNLVADDTNGFADVFVHDAQTREVTRVSVSSSGAEADRESSAPRISADGRYVVFESVARNFVTDDTNNRTDVFVHDRDSATTTRVSVGVGGAQGDKDSTAPTISDDGRYIAFYSESTNLVAADNNLSGDVFVRDTVDDTTTRESVSSIGGEANDSSSAPVISGDGGSLVFESFATNLVGADTNSRKDIFRRDRVTGSVQLVSQSTAGLLGNGVSSGADVSDDGGYISFRSASTNLVADDTNGATDIFVRNVAMGVTTRVSVDNSGAQANSLSGAAAISGDGRYVAFSSLASNLVPGDTNGWEDVFVHEIHHSWTTLKSFGLGEIPADSKSYQPTISSNGRYIGFVSNASNLVDAGDGSVPQIYKTWSQLLT